MEEIKVAFLDRDGTIVKEYDDNGWINRTEPEFLSNSIEGLKAISHLGYKIIIITNQGLINKGYISWDNYNMFTSNMLRILLENGIEIFDIFFFHQGGRFLPPFDHSFIRTIHILYSHPSEVRYPHDTGSYPEAHTSPLRFLPHSRHRTMLLNDSDIHSPHTAPAFA